MKNDRYLERSTMSGFDFLTGDVNFMDYGGINERYKVIPG